MNYDDLVKDFACRTRHNLEVVRKSRSEGREAYEVTQLINSMLGLLVLPKERYYESIPKTPLDNLKALGWPEPVLSGEFTRPKHLRDLVRLLRNSIAHFNIEFLPHGTGEIRGVVLCNKCGCGRVTWRATLSLSDLESLTERFVALVLGEDDGGGPE